MSLARRGVARTQRMPPAPAPRQSDYTAALHVCSNLPLVQPDATASGPAVLLFLRMLDDDELRGSITTASAPEAEFAEAALATRARTNGVRDRSGQWQLPWHRRGDTRPAALIRELGRGWHNRVIDPGHRDFAYDVIVTYTSAGWHIPLYVGDASWMQHTVLVVGANAHTITLYEPRSGTVLERHRDAFCSGSLDLAGWQEPWLFILPGQRPGYRFA